MKRLVLIALALLLSSTVGASVPSTLSVQGRLLNAGSPMTGSHPAQFKIFDVATGGAALWSESGSIDVEAGIFTAVLGASTPIPALVFGGSSRWLEVAVDGATLSPRLPLTTNA